MNEPVNKVNNGLSFEPMLSNNGLTFGLSSNKPGLKPVLTLNGLGIGYTPKHKQSDSSTIIHPSDEE